MWVGNGLSCALGLLTSTHSATSAKAKGRPRGGPLLWMNGVLDRGVQSHRLRRRGRPSDFVSVPRTLTGALKVPGARVGAGPLKATTQDAPSGCGHHFDFFGFFLRGAAFFCMTTKIAPVKKPRECRLARTLPLYTNVRFRELPPLFCPGRYAAGTRCDPLSTRCDFVSTPCDPASSQCDPLSTKKELVA